MENWKELRKNATKVRIGYPELIGITNSSAYELFISVREDVYWSSSPGGLTTNSYNGHVFWDFETWMYPVYLVMNPIFAKNGLQYRFDHLEGARKKAKDNKYLGTMWPWESPYSGDEVTPRYAKTGQMELSQATLSLLLDNTILNSFPVKTLSKNLHRNPEVRKNLLCPLTIYWAGRVEKDNKGMHHIIPPDEYAENVAKISLDYACECRFNATWHQMASNMHVEYDAKLDYLLNLLATSLIVLLNRLMLSFCFYWTMLILLFPIQFCLIILSSLVSS